jgi:RHS repeat-associated protein
VAVALIGGPSAHTVGSGPHTRSFSVRNTGTAGATFTLRCAAGGSVECQTANLGSQTLGAGAETTVGVPYRIRTTGGGWVDLVASSSSGGGVTGSARLTVTVTAPPVTVTADSTTLVPKPTGTGPYTTSFTVRNGAPGAGTFDFECFAAGGVVCEGDPPSAVLGGFGDSRSVAVSYRAGALPGPGTVTLRAINRSNPSDNASAQVSVRTERFGIAVSPVDSAITRRAGQTRVEAFTVVNTGSVASDFTAECASSGLVVCVEAPGTIRVAAGASTVVLVTYRIGDASSGNVLSLTLAHEEWREIEGTGRYAVSAVDGGVAVVTGRSLGVPPGSSRSHRIAVRNTGMTQVRVSVSATCAGSVFASACSVSPSVLDVPGGGERTASVGLTTRSQAGAVGQLIIRASPIDDPLAFDSAVVAVSLGSPVRLTVSTASAAFPDRHDPSGCLTVALGPGAVSECGVLRAIHPLPTVRTMNRARTPALLYKSALAHPNPVVAADVGLPVGGLTPDSVRGRLIVAGALRDTRTWEGGVWGPGRAARVALSFDGFNLNTGVYPYDLEIVAHAGGSVLSTTVSGEVVVVNRKQSRYGAGWWLSGLEQLRFVPGGGDRILWVGGDGGWVLYRPVAGANGQWVAASSTRPDTLWWDAGGKRYVRTLPGRVEVRFDAQGRHVETRNRLGHVTRFVYDGDPGNQDRERVLEIRVPVPAGSAMVGYRFEYGDGLAPDGNANNDRLDRVVTLPGRAQQQVTHTIRTGGNQNGARIGRIADPGGRVVRFAYLGSPNQHRMRWREDGRGARTTFQYDATGRVTEVEREAGSGLTPVRLALQPGMSLGLEVAMDTADAYAQVDGPRTDVRDVTRYWLDAAGAPRRIVDPLGHETLLDRTDARFPALVTRVESPVGLVSRAFHDARGNVDSTSMMRAAGLAVTRYRWDPRFDFATRAVLPEGEMTESEYDPASGNRRWTQQAGQVSSRVAFRYTADGLVRAVDPPLIPADSMAYDALGNLRLVVSAGGLRRTIHRDAFGRDTLIVTPLDTGQTAMSRRRMTYDGAGRVVKEVTAADPVRFTHLPAAPTMPAESTTVRTEYDAEGNVRRVVRISTPDINEIDSIVTVWRYDLLGRVVAEVAPDGDIDSTVYDAAGNVTQSYTRRGHVIHARYDVLNRVRERIVPQVDYDDFTWVVPGQNWRFPLIRTEQPLIPADTMRFTYDALGHVVQADNRDARVSRRYDADGTMVEEIARVRTYRGGDWSRHVYRQRYGYDRNGRRTWHAHPPQLAPLVAGERRDTVYYEYDAFGRLDSVRTLFEDLVFAHEYDDVGRLRAMRAPGGVEERRDYDAEGRMRYRSVGSAGAWLVRDSLTFDAQGRVVAARGLGGRHDTRMGYTGLGALARSYETVNDWVGTGWTSQTEELYSADALGNWRSSFRSSLTEPSTPSEESADYTYQRGTGRLLEQSKRAGFHWPNPSNDSIGVLVTSTEYDESGNKRVEATLGPANAPAVLRRSEFYYGADNRLRLVDKRSCYVEPVFNGPPQGEVGCNTQTRLAFADRWAFEEYRYDALGRRILTRSWEETCAGSGCVRALQRTVWDGDQVLYEIRYPNLSEQNAGVVDLGDSIPGPPTCSPGCDTYRPQEIFPYGVIGYVHAAGVDDPLMAIRMFYGPQRSAPFAIVPHANWRGAYVTGTDGAGQAHGECAASAPSCVAISWPGARQFAGFKPRGYSEDGPAAWMGSLLSGNRDASGQLYMRNRYYDPETGRFTQEDPIGLAGGINLYGFAGGDPVNYRDPFGLSDCTIHDWRKCTLFKFSFGFGFKGVGTEATLGPVQLGLRVLSAGTDVNATGTPDGIEGAVDASFTLVSGHASMYKAAIRGSIGCSGARSSNCSVSGSVGIEEDGVRTSNSSVGGSVSVGFFKVGMKVDVLETGTAFLGATSDLVLGVAKFAYDQLMGRPGFLPTVGPVEIGGN